MVGVDVRDAGVEAFEPADHTKRLASESNRREIAQCSASRSGAARSGALLVHIHEDPYDDDGEYAEDSCGSGVSEIAALG
jgi:hypothetical protein